MTHLKAHPAVIDTAARSIIESDFKRSRRLSHSKSFRALALQLEDILNSTGHDLTVRENKQGYDIVDLLRSLSDHVEATS